MVTLFAEWIDYMDAYRLYDPRFPQQSVAYVDNLEDVDGNEYEVIEV